MTEEIQQLVVRGSLLGQQIRNIYYGKYNDPLGGTDSGPFTDSYLGYIYAAAPGAITSLLSFDYYDIYYRSSNHWVFRETRVLEAAGTSTAEVLPMQTAVVLLGKVADWRGFGRKFIAGLTEDQQNASVLVAGAITAFGSMALDYVSPVVEASISWTPGIFTPTGQFHPFTSWVLDTVIGSMRRRKFGVGS